MIKQNVLNPGDVFDDREPVNYVDVMEHGVEDLGGGAEMPWVAPAESEVYEYDIPHEVVGFPGVAEPAYPFPFIVITNEKWWYGEGENDYKDQGDVEGALQNFYNWKMRKGVPLHIVMVDDIVANWDGTDKQDKIRNWMIDVYEAYGTEAFFLVGDTASPTGTYANKWDEWGRYGVVPSRYLCTSPDEYSKKAVSDLYYICLEGSWGPKMVSGVGYWGVAGARPVPINPTVFVGRIPIGDVDPPVGPGASEAETETENYVAKLKRYEKNPPSGYVNDALLIGADFGVNAVWNQCPKIKSKYFSSWSTTEIYEDNTTRYPTYPRPHDVFDALEDGPAVTFIATHGHPLCQYILTHGTGDGPGEYIQEFTVDEDVALYTANEMMFATGLKKVNTGNKYGLHFAHACSTFKYDWRDAESLECLGEEFLADADGGGVAYVGNTSPGYVFGCFDIAHDYFFDYLLNKEMYDVGRALAKARTDYIKAKNVFYDAYILNLGGDPTMELWTAEPEALSMTYSSWKEGPTYTLEVEVKDPGGSPVSGVKVTLWQAMYYLTETTTSSSGGKVRFRELLFGFEDGKLTATKHDYKPDLEDNVVVEE